MINDYAITFITKIFARFFTKYFPMARFPLFPAGLEAAGPLTGPPKCGPSSMIRTLGFPIML
jgi:hypothetical protein